MAVLAGGGAVGYIAGPGLVMIGVLEGISATYVATGTALGLSAGASISAMLDEKLVDSVYENALKWIVQVIAQANL